MANEVSVATQVSKTRACKPGKILVYRFTYMLRLGECRLSLCGFNIRFLSRCVCVSVCHCVCVSVYVWLCVCMRFSMFVSAFVMRSYVCSCASACSCMCGFLTASCSLCMWCLCGSCLAGGSSDRRVRCLLLFCVCACVYVHLNKPVPSVQEL